MEIKEYADSLVLVVVGSLLGKRSSSTNFIVSKPLFKIKLSCQQKQHKNKSKLRDTKRERKRASRLELPGNSAARVDLDKVYVQS